MGGVERVSWGCGRVCGGGVVGPLTPLVGAGGNARGHLSHCKVWAAAGSCAGVGVLGVEEEQQEDKGVFGDVLVRDKEVCLGV